MSKMLEIEYKSMLTEKEYDQLIQHYQLEPKDFTVQTNIYFDTPDFQLAKKNCGLRIRLLDTYAEYTLKTPEVAGRLETTDTLTMEKVDSYLNQHILPTSGAVFQKLSELNIDLKLLIETGKLTTKRAEFKVAEGLLAIDQSFGENLHDFELELEVADATVGKIAFEQFLEAHFLPYRPAKNKIQRMIESKD